MYNYTHRCKYGYIKIMVFKGTRSIEAWLYIIHISMWITYIWIACIYIHLHAQMHKHKANWGLEIYYSQWTALLFIVRLLILSRASCSGIHIHVLIQYLCIHLCIHAYICTVFVYVCVCICIYIHTHMCILFAVDSSPVYRAPLNLVASKLLGYFGIHVVFMCVCFVLCVFYMYTTWCTLVCVFCACVQHVVYTLYPFCIHAVYMCVCVCINAHTCLWNICIHAHTSLYIICCAQHPVYRAPLNLVARKLLGYLYSCAGLLFFIYVCAYIHIHAQYLYMCVCTYIYTYTYMYMIRCGQHPCVSHTSLSCCEQDSRVFISMCWFKYSYTCLSINTYTCTVCVCVCVCKCIYIHTHKCILFGVDSIPVYRTPLYLCYEQVPRVFICVR